MTQGSAAPANLELLKEIEAALKTAFTDQGYWVELHHHLGPVGIEVVTGSRAVFLTPAPLAPCWSEQPGKED